jgi:hypothetical protein
VRVWAAGLVLPANSGARAALAGFLSVRCGMMEGVPKNTKGDCVKLALMSDIHANMQALDACLAHARAQQAQRFVFSGRPGGLWRRPRPGGGTHPTAHGRRRHGHPGKPRCHGHRTHRMSKTVGIQTATWTHASSDAEQRAWIARLPLTLQLDKIFCTRQRERARTCGATCTTSAPPPPAWTQRQTGRKFAMYLAAMCHAQTLYYRGTATA